MPRAAWPLVGRREELEFINHALSEGSRGIVLAGAAGVGKTRLAHEALNSSAKAGATVEWAIATRAASSIPFGALAPLLPEPGEERSDPYVVLRRGTKAIAERAEKGRLILGIDDAHLLDEASAALVHQVVITGAALLVATVRTGEVAPDPIVALWKDGLLNRLEVQPLSSGEVEQLIPAALSGRVSATTAYELWRASQGNVLLLRELILGGLDSGALVQERGLWRWRGPLAVSPRLSEVLETRLRGLTSEQREVVELVSVAETLGMRHLEALTTLVALDSVEEKGLVQVEWNGQRNLVRLSHPLYAELLRGSIPPVRARSLRRRLSESLEHLDPKRREDILRVATWRLEAGTGGSPEIFFKGARYAMEAFDYPLAERLAKVASDASAGFEAELLLADALRSQRKGREAEAVLEGLEQRSDSLEQRARAAILRAYNLFFAEDSASRAEEVLESAARAVEGTGWAENVASARAVLNLYSGRPSQVLALGLTPTLDAALAIAPALAISGRSGEALGVVDKALIEAERLELEGDLYRGQLAAIKFLILELAGHLDEAETMVSLANQIALTLRAHDAIALFSLSLGKNALDRGRVVTAAHRFEEAASLLRERDRNNFLAWCFGGLALAKTFAGDLSGAESALREGREVCPRSVRLFEIDFVLSQAWARAVRGDVIGAQEIALRAASLANETGQYAFEATALHDAARLGRAKEVLDRLTELASTIDGAWAPAFAAHVEAVVARDAEAMESASRQFESMGALLLAAEAAAQAASAHTRAGRPGRALGARERAQSLAEKCEGARTPLLSQVLADRPHGLTIREEQIVRLAAEGLSSREIAERLVLSVRTVNNHLQHAYYKLGVSSRRELRGAVGLHLKPAEG